MPGLGLGLGVGNEKRKLGKWKSETRSGMAPTAVESGLNPTSIYSVGGRWIGGLVNSDSRLQFFACVVRTRSIRIESGFKC